MHTATIPDASADQAQPRKPANDAGKLIEAYVTAVEGAEHWAGELEVNELILSECENAIFYVG